MVEFMSMFIPAKQVVSDIHLKPAQPLPSVSSKQA